MTQPPVSIDRLDRIFVEDAVNRPVVACDPLRLMNNLTADRAVENAAISRLGIKLGSAFDEMQGRIRIRTADSTGHVARRPFRAPFARVITLVTHALSPSSEP